MTYKNINNLINTSKWRKLIEDYDIKEILSNLSFKDSMILSYKMLYNKDWDEDIQNDAVNILYAIKNKWPEEWNSSWKYDSFLGIACELTLKYDERYEAYKEAVKKANPAPPSLLVMLAGCYSSPGIPPISREEAESLLKEALRQEISVEGAVLMKGICKRKDDFRTAQYWENVFEKAKKENLHIHGLTPPFLIDVVLD